MSKYSRMSVSVPPASIADLVQRISLLPPALQDPCHFLFRTAQFRSSRDTFEQIDQLRSSLALPWDHIAVLYNVPKSTIYDRWNAHKKQLERLFEVPPTPTTERAHHSNMTREQEIQLIEWIRQRQKQSRCPTVHEVREHASVLAGGQGENKPFSKYWWRSFKRRHESEITTKILDSREAARTKVKAEDVLHYFGQVSAALGRITSLSQMINMDESGFSSRIDKGRKRKCVILKSCRVTPKFQEQDGSSHLTIVSTIALSGDVLRPMFITKEHVDMNGSFANDSIFARSLHFETKKGYQDEASMVFWIQNCLAEYVSGVQTKLGDPDAPVFLIMDNCPSHNTPAVQAAFRNVRGLEIIWMPAHSSHFLQMLDACYFGVMKNEYRLGNTTKQKPKVAGKLIRAFRASWIASYPTTVMRSWQLTGFAYTGLGTATQGARLCLRSIVELVKVNCPDFEDFVGAPW